MMALLLNDYRKLARGLTNDTALTDYLNSKNMPHFDSSQEKAKRLLNQYTVGIKKPDKDLHIEGLADFEKQTLTVKKRHGANRIRFQRTGSKVFR